jgi:membrane-bound serine protease (ClpP class)
MSSSTFLRTILIVCFGSLLALGLTGPALAQGQQAPHALVLRVDGIINPVKERLISRAIEQAEDSQATLAIIQLDTPGGLLDSTRKIVEMMLESDVPIAVYVSPRGAQAGSAGTFITAAANFAVMAPATNIGAATPVSATGEDLNETLANKATNDAAALIRSIAQVRDRNAEKLEETVREAASFSATEAVELNIVDFIATDLEDLLAQLDGRVVETNSGAITLNTQDVQLRRVEKTFLEHFLEFISDPNVSFILITVGSLGLIVELFNPGLVVPGVVGAISLLLAFLALGNLPFNWAGVAFIILATVLMGLEILVAGFGILGIGAIISFIVGGLLLFAQFGGGSPTLPPISVNLWLLGGMAGVMALGLLFVARTIQQSRKPGSQPDIPSLVGAAGRVIAELSPRGAVWVRNETWTAVSEDGNVIGVGEPVKVTKVEGLVLTVSRYQQTDTQS